ncbi:MAG: hypothetical protein K2J16_01230 [Clostridia bacterium]|nr:hypothetical protein [Clostridia bacterium]
MKNSTKPKRYDLDLSATFYPYMTSKKAQSLFCVSATLSDKVDKEKLCKAVNEVMDRFPTYKVRLKKGYSKYYLEENFKKVLVFEWNNRPQTPINTKLTNGYQFRLSYEDKRVYLEMFHALTDANGAMKLLLATLRRYRELTGISFEGNCDILTAKESVPAAELEDSFVANYKPIPLSKLNLKSMAGGAPFRVTGELSEHYHIVSVECESAKLLEKSRAMGVSLTAYISAITARAMANSAKKRDGKLKRPLALMIPVNLRNLFESVTAHNFITFVRIVLDEKDCESLDVCAKSCAKQLAEKVNKEDMQRFIATTVRAQRNLLFRIVPLPVKWLLMRFGRLFMKSRQTIIISNLGNIKVPAELGVESLSLYLNVSKNNVHNLGIASTNGVVSLAFTNAIKNTDVPDEVLKELGC